MKKPLAVKSDHKLTFDHYVKSLCKRANAKLKSLAKFVPYMGLVKKKIVDEFLFCRANQLLPANMENLEPF